MCDGMPLEICNKIKIFHGKILEVTIHITAKTAKLLVLKYFTQTVIAKLMLTIDED